MNKDKFAVISIRAGYKRHHVSYDIILGIENEFCRECGADLFCIESENCRHNIDSFREYIDSGGDREAYTKGLPDESMIGRLKDYDYVFFATMAEDDLLIHINTLRLLKDKLIVYIIDSWVPLWPAHEKVIRAIAPLCAAFAYKKSAEHFKSVLDCVVIEMPQSMDVDVFHPHDVKQNRLFIQIGRKNKMLHKSALNYCKEHKLSNNENNYAYQRVGKDYWKNALRRPFYTFYKFARYRSLAMLAFPSMEGVSKEISASRFSLCAPQCVDNYQKTGDISEVTPRYYEIMACKSIPVGIKPVDTFDELFPYEDAMIEVDEENFAASIEALLGDEERYSNIVERNYEYCMTHHRWKNRYESLMSQLRDKL